MTKRIYIILFSLLFIVLSGCSLGGVIVDVRFNYDGSRIFLVKKLFKDMIYSPAISN